MPTDDPGCQLQGLTSIGQAVVRRPQPCLLDRWPEAGTGYIIGVLAQAVARCGSPVSSVFQGKEARSRAAVGPNARVLIPPIGREVQNLDPLISYRR
jgi:hypothetical protein